MPAPFDPAAATAAYLAVLPPEAHTKATAYTQGGHWLLLWSAIVAVAIAWAVLRSGVLVRLRERLERGGPQPWRMSVAVVFVYGLIEAVIGLPWSLYSGWWREKTYGLTSQPLGGWLSEWAIDLAISAVLLSLLLSAVYAVIRRLPRTWWIWGGGITGVGFLTLMVLSPVFIEPLFNDYTPAPPGQVRETVVAMAKANGVPSDKIYIYDGSKQSNRYTANVSGLFGTARIAMSDVMFKKDADIAEVRAVVGHEMGHYVHTHSIWIMLGLSTLALIGFFMVDRLFPAVQAGVPAAGVRGLADPAGYPILSIILTVLGLLATPLQSSIIRIAESDADSFSLQRFNEPDGLAKALVKTIEHRAATPSRLEEVLFYDHPSVGARVRKAMDWKAAHPE